MDAILQARITQLAHWVFEGRLTPQECEAHFRIILEAVKRLQAQEDKGGAG